MKPTGKKGKITCLLLTSLLLMLALGALTARADQKAWPRYRVSVEKGYLAIRTDPSYDDRNEFGQLYTGDYVYMIDNYSNSTYWKVQSEKYTSPGWVNKNYLVSADVVVSSYGDYKVSVAKGYLALRSWPSYDDDNEIGELYTGDIVTVKDKSNSQYWWVYSSKYKTEGYVNKDYLTSIVSGDDYRVSVAKGYLALRSWPTYDDDNEIGELYTGDVVTVRNRNNSQYWWVYSPKYQTEGYVNKDYLVK